MLIGYQTIGRESVIQQFSRTSPGEDLRPGLVLQDRTIVCWLNVAGDLVTAKEGKTVFLARSMWNHVICVIPQSIFIYTHYS